MKADTRLFGEIDIAEDKIITLENGMVSDCRTTGDLPLFLMRGRRRRLLLCGFSRWMIRRQHFL